MERNERLKAADKCASRYTNENEARIAKKAFMLGCEFEAQGEAIKGVILDTLEEPKKRNALFDKCVENCAPATMKEVSDKVYKILQEPDVDLEKEMDEYFENMVVQEHENIFEDTYQMIARHFYELGLNARKEEL